MTFARLCTSIGPEEKHPTKPFKPSAVILAMPTNKSAQFYVRRFLSLSMHVGLGI
jgi:hypothetical protein